MFFGVGLQTGEFVFAFGFKGGEFGFALRADGGPFEFQFLLQRFQFGLAKLVAGDMLFRLALQVRVPAGGHRGAAGVRAERECGEDQ